MQMSVAERDYLETETGALQRLTVDHLTEAGFSVSPSGMAHDSRVRIAGDGVVWLLQVTDQAEAYLVRLPTDATARDPHHLAGLATTLLTGRPDTATPNTARTYPEVRLDRIAGLDLRARGFDVEVKVYIDDFCLDVLSDIEVTNPPGAAADPHARVTIDDDGILAWRRDYWPDHAVIDGAADSACPYRTRIPDPSAVAAAVTAAIAPALARRA